jgi:hypothetical protein
MKRIVVTSLATLAFTLLCATGAYAQGDREPHAVEKVDRASERTDKADRPAADRDREPHDSASQGREVNREPAMSPKRKEEVFQGTVDRVLGPDTANAIRENRRDLERVAPDPKPSPKPEKKEPDPPDMN